MYLTVGEVSKSLGISTELIRFYVREGIIKPHQNQENGYWEYSSDDVMRLSDVIFYRTLNLSLNEIKSIFDGLELEKIGLLIEAKKTEALEYIEKYTKILKEVQEWQKEYHRELSLLGTFKLGKMPSEIRKDGYYDEKDHIARYIRNNLNMEKDDWGSASFSFYCNLNEEPLCLRRYLSLNKTAANAARNMEEDVIEESAERCLYTVVHWSDDLREMIGPLVSYAEEQGYLLSGEIYGRENTNYFIEGRRMALYRVYAPLKMT